MEGWEKCPRPIPPTLFFPRPLSVGLRLRGGSDSQNTPSLAWPGLVWRSGFPPPPLTLLSAKRVQEIAYIESVKYCLD
eukprot:scaffold1319_cov204-Ochromonas_danica.AAC.9